MYRPYAERPAGRIFVLTRGALTGGASTLRTALTQQQIPDEPPEEVRPVGGGAGEASHARGSLDDTPV